MAEEKADIALVGLAVMGQNLILNMNDHGYKVCAFNRTVSKVHDFLNKEAKGTNVCGAESLEEMVSMLKKPAKIVLLVMAGKPVDSFIENLIPLLSAGDIIIDGGNSDFNDSQEKNIHFVGCGVSGGEDGARYGPSLMPGGSVEAWPHIMEIFQKISAKAYGAPCCSWMGTDGAGHYVKMVHNGIEYGDMQLISEAYFVMKTLLQMPDDEIADVFEQWNKEELESYLIEITRDVLRFKDDDGQPLVEKIIDSAGQKGTGKWTVINSLHLGTPVTLIAEAVFSRCLSSLKSERMIASKTFSLKSHSQITTTISASEKMKLVGDIKYALYASKIVSYAQGFMLLKEASQQYQWSLNLGQIALTWRGGCIIRSRFLNDIFNAYDKNPQLINLVLDDFFKHELDKCQVSWRRVVSMAVLNGISVPAFSSALSFFDGYRTEYLPANLIQAQRDYFGAHTYERLTQPGKFIHTNWTGHGGNVSASTYKR